MGEKVEKKKWDGNKKSELLTEEMHADPQLHERKSDRDACALLDRTPSITGSGHAKRAETSAVLKGRQRRYLRTEILIEEKKGGRGAAARKQLGILKGGGGVNTTENARRKEPLGKRTVTKIRPKLEEEYKNGRKKEKNSGKVRTLGSRGKQLKI